MEFRVGPYVFGAGQFLLPVAFVYFITLTAARARSHLGLSRRASMGVSCAAAMTAAGFALGLGLVGARVFAETPAGGSVLPQSLIGGVWGALAGAAAVGHVIRREAWATADTVLVPTFAAAAIARGGCLFTGCCLGSLWSPGGSGGWTPFRHWAAWDLALLAGLFIAALFWERRTALSLHLHRLPVLLMLHAVVRFVLEFMRVPWRPVLCLSFGQWLLAAQFLVALLLLVQARRSGDLRYCRRPTSRKPMPDSSPGPRGRQPACDPALPR